MQDYVENARACLAAYLERGEAVAERLDARDADGALTLLRKRAAAFHNFRALDVVARRCGVDLADEAGFKDLLARVSDQAQTLSAKLATARAEAESQIAKVAAERRNLRFFRAGDGHTTSFERVV